MVAREDFIRGSVELNLFFQRIMKEHLFFLETNIQPVDAGLKTQAKQLKTGFEELLAQTIRVANGVVSQDAIMSNEFVTPFTLKAEEVTS
ncbi:MAG: DUF2935 domain-containing protein, partial [Clostridiales bacterium]|nr:DUF2935 domain-containing protein [Clostridiales bacterium]